MDKHETLKLLKQAAEKVPYLRALPYGNGAFAAWKDNVCHILESAYGKDSSEYRRFINAPGISFIIRTEKGLEQDYLWRLDCYESVLDSLVSGQR